jgi:hypothetical protein
MSRRRRRRTGVGDFERGEWVLCQRNVQVTKFRGIEASVQFWQWTGDVVVKEFAVHVINP